MRTTIIAGLIASVVMAMMEMIYEGMFGVGFWSAPIFIAATLLRDLQGVALPVPFSLVPVVLGMMGHMMNSVALGILFVGAFGRFLNSRFSGAIAGSIFALGVFGVMWYGV